MPYPSILRPTFLLLAALSFVAASGADQVFLSGDYVVTDGTRRQILLISPAGDVSVVYQGGPGQVLAGIALDERGDFIVSDFNGELFAVTAAGDRRTIARGARLQTISGVTIDTDGSYLVSRFDPPAVLRITQNGLIIPLAAGDPLSGPFNQVAVTQSGEVIVTDFSGRAIRQIDQNGEVTTLFEGPPVRAPDGVIVDAAGDYIFADRTAPGIYRLTPAGQIFAVVEGDPLVNPIGIALDADGNYLVTDSLFDTVFVVTPSGEVTEVPTGLSNRDLIGIDVLPPIGSIAGSVTLGGQPLVGARVIRLNAGSPRAHATTITDETGVFRFPLCREGSYTVVVVPPDDEMEAVPVSVEVTADTEVEITVDL